MDFLLEKKSGNDYFGIVVVKGDFDIVSEKQEIQQRVMINLSTFIKENFALPAAGVDYYNNVYPYDADDITLQDTFKNTILNTTGVIGLSEFAVAQNKETLSVLGLLDTVAGEIRITFNTV